MVSYRYVQHLCPCNLETTGIPSRCSPALSRLIGGYVRLEVLSCSNYMYSLPWNSANISFLVPHNNHLACEISNSLRRLLFTLIPSTSRHFHLFEMSVASQTNQSSFHIFRLLFQKMILGSSQKAASCLQNAQIIAPLVRNVNTPRKNVEKYDFSTKNRKYSLFFVARE